MKAKFPLTVMVRFQAEGFHRWPGASGGRSYLASPHRHLFHVQLEVSTNGADREVEFHELLALAKLSFGTGDFGGKSCEEMAARLVTRVLEVYGDRAITAEVWEDGECGARMTRA